MSEALVTISEEMANVVERAAASLVRVEGRRRMPASGIVWSADGVIVTAHHVVTRDENVRVGLPGGERVAAAVAGRDPSTDIAVLRVEASGLAAPDWVDPEALRVGHLVLALGRPGADAQATLGIISALGDAWRTGGGGQVERFMQTDVVMYPGFSGGPLVDAGGRFAGLNSSALARGLSLTLPAPTLRRVVSTLLEHGHMRQGYLGVGAQPARLPDALAEELGQETGLLLVSVEPDSPAGRAGLLMGDTILALDGEPVRGLEELLGLLSADRVGQTVPVRIWRGGTLHSVDVTIGERQ